MNQAGFESSVEEMTQGRVMPCLQDTNQSHVMTSYGINKDDLVILDRKEIPWKQVHTSGSFNFYTDPGPDSLAKWLREVP